MKKGAKIVIWILVILLVLYLLWKFVIKTNKITLSDGSEIYKKGGNYYTNIDGAEAKIDATEYNRLKTHVEGSCTNPNPTTQDVTPCDYFGFKGQVDDCGNCAGIRPLVKNCSESNKPCMSGGQAGVLKLSGSDSKECYYSCYVYSK